MKLEDAGYDTDGYEQYRIVFDSPLEEAECELRKYKQILRIKQLECLLSDKKEEQRLLREIEYWKRRLENLKSFNTPGWDIT